MDKEIRKKAAQKVEAKMGFFICAVTFICTAMILVMLSIFMPYVAIWLLLPIPAMAMVLGIIYIQVFGFSFSGTPSTDWKEEEIQKEMIRLYQEKRASQPPSEELSENDRLELKELERLKEKWEWRADDYVD